MTDPNPYAAPTSPTLDQPDPSSIILEPKDMKRAEAVVKDAGQFWLAILVCVLCSILGALLIPFWYTFRLWQWNSLARKYPELVADGTPKNSFQAKFKSSRWKLIVAIVVGALILAFVAFSTFNMILAIEQAARPSG